VLLNPVPSPAASARLSDQQISVVSRPVPETDNPFGILVRCICCGWKSPVFRLNVRGIRWHAGELDFVPTCGIQPGPAVTCHFEPDWDVSAGGNVGLPRMHAVLSCRRDQLACIHWVPHVFDFGNILFRIAQIQRHLSHPMMEGVNRRCDLTRGTIRGYWTVGKPQRNSSCFGSLFAKLKDLLEAATQRAP